MTTPLLSVRELTVAYGPDRPVVDRLSFDIKPGEALALVGESGCGKSTTALALMGLLAPDATATGNIALNGAVLPIGDEYAMRRLRSRRLSMIFQEPMSSLNPVHRIGDQIGETLIVHQRMDRKQARLRTLDLLDMVQLSASRIGAYPHELSGGQRQRVMIAMAIACNPALLIADEPTTALDATVQAQVLELLDGLRRDLSMGLLLVSHDLNLVSQWTDRVLVMHHGQILEQLSSSHLHTAATHPYSRGLIEASVTLDGNLHYSTQPLSEIVVHNEGDRAYDFSLRRPALPAARTTLAEAGPLLEVDNLAVQFDGPCDRQRAVDDVSFTIAPGETVGLIGEFGSGKSTLSKALIHLVPTSSGRILLNGEDVTRARRDRLRRLRDTAQMIFQDPFGSLNPRHSVHDILSGTLRAHGIRDNDEQHRRIVDMLDRVGLPSTAASRYPHEFSGGQRQRIAIARALIAEPALVICDEPVSALDVSIQAQILNLLSELKASLNLSYLFISHDLAVVQYMADRILVMKDGKIVEQGDRRRVLERPASDYTRTLINAVPGRGDVAA